MYPWSSASSDPPPTTITLMFFTKSQSLRELLVPLGSGCYVPSKTEMPGLHFQLHSLEITRQQRAGD